MSKFSDLSSVRAWVRNAYPIICVGLIGCFLTSVTGVTAVMVMRGWTEQGGWIEWAKRVAIGYPASTLIVFLVFPWMVPKLTKYFSSFLEDHK
jgi:hypothetical protein